VKKSERARFERMHRVMAGFVERGDVPGLVTLVERRGELHVDAIGTKAVAGNDPMTRDSIFRITSMTKPITAVAGMILIEECRLRLDDPVDDLLPELADRRVLRSVDAPLGETIPANRPITVRDVMTFRMGIGMIFGPPDLYPIQKAITEFNLAGFGPPRRDVAYGPDEFMRRLGALPLMYQPGEVWLYNTGAYVLGVLVERASGQSLESFFCERIFEPLGMKDTGFYVRRSKIGRLPAAYSLDDSGALVLDEDVADKRWEERPAFADGGAGLVSTIDDYAAFARMLLNKGRAGKERILSRPSVELMTMDHLDAEEKIRSTQMPGQWDAAGWGFGVMVTNRRHVVGSTPASYGWSGGYGTGWANDPAEEMLAILMTQREEFPPFSRVHRDFWTSVYQTID
jgi:CubicO group peptidase (beta-lactamase class C family)